MMNKKNEIALYGIAGLYNYGCEAIVRGTVTILRYLDPNCEITYYSFDYENDIIKISDLNISVKKVVAYKNIFLRGINRLFFEIKIPKRIPDHSINKIIRNANTIFSIGGDIYTIPQYLLYKEKYPYYNRLVQMGDKVLKKKKKLIIWGASIGPFGNYVKAKQYYFQHFKKVTYIFAREKNTRAYLYENGINDNLIFFPDPAFFVQESNKTEKEEYIGINISPLSMKEVYGNVSDEAFKNICVLIEKIIKIYREKILLIPHVVNPYLEIDNDYLFMNKIFLEIKKKYSDMIVLSEASKSYLEAKKEIRKCKILVTARMHCGINAICERVPTIFLAYSEKAKGMSKLVYGNTHWLVPLNELNTLLVPKIKQLLEERNEVKKILDKNISEIQNLNNYRKEIEIIFEHIKNEKTKK